MPMRAICNGSPWASACLLRLWRQRWRTTRRTSALLITASPQTRFSQACSISLSTTTLIRIWPIFSEQKDTRSRRRSDGAWRALATRRSCCTRPPTERSWSRTISRTSSCCTTPGGAGRPRGVWTSPRRHPDPASASACGRFSHAAGSVPRSRPAADERAVPLAHGGGLAAAAVAPRGSARLLRHDDEAALGQHQAVFGETGPLQRQQRVEIAVEREVRDLPRHHREQIDQLAQRRIGDAVLVLTVEHDRQAGRHETGGVLVVQTVEALFAREEALQLPPVPPAHLLGDDVPAAVQHPRDFSAIQIFVPVEH